jgi:hypothetical protein
LFFCFSVFFFNVIFSVLYCLCLLFVAIGIEAKLAAQEAERKRRADAITAHRKAVERKAASEGLGTATTTISPTPETDTTALAASSSSAFSSSTPSIPSPESPASPVEMDAADATMAQVCGVLCCVVCFFGEVACYFFHALG